MKTGLSAFSRLELLGIVLMISGICLGFYGRIVGPRTISKASQSYSSNRGASDVNTDVKDLVKSVVMNIERGQKAFQLEGIGQWWFFTGLGIFVVSRRSKWNTDLQGGQIEQ